MQVHKIRSRSCNSSGDCVYGAGREFADEVRARLASTLASRTRALQRLYSSNTEAQSSAAVSLGVFSAQASDRRRSSSQNIGGPRSEPEAIQFKYCFTPRYLVSFVRTLPRARRRLADLHEHDKVKEFARTLGGAVETRSPKRRPNREGTLLVLSTYEMCGRAAQGYDDEEDVAAAMDAAPAPNPGGGGDGGDGGGGGTEARFTTAVPVGARPGFNLAPGATLLIVVASASSASDAKGTKRELRSAMWGMVPSAKADRDPWRMFNARDDNLDRVHAARCDTRRCVIPLTGYFEWENRVELGARVKQPWFVSARPSEGTRPWLLVAGIYERWPMDSSSPSSSEFWSVSLVTTDASRDLEWMHNRMPCVLSPDEVDTWLDPGTPLSRVRRLLRPRGADVLCWWPVTRAMTRLSFRGPSVVAPVDLARERGGSDIRGFFAASPQKRARPEEDRDGDGGNEKRASTLVSDTPDESR